MVALPHRARPWPHPRWRVRHLGGRLPACSLRSQASGPLGRLARGGLGGSLGPDGGGRPSRAGSPPGPWSCSRGDHAQPEGTRGCRLRDAGSLASHRVRLPAYLCAITCASRWNWSGISRDRREISRPDVVS